MRRLLRPFSTLRSRNGAIRVAGAGSVVAALVLVMGLDSPEAAAKETVPARGPGARGLTSYEAGPLRHATLVIVGRTLGVREQRQQQIAQVEVLQVLLGKPPSRPLTVFVKGPHPAAKLVDAVRTSFPVEGSGRHVFFLAHTPRSLSADFRDAFEAEGRIGAAKVKALAREIELSRIEDPERRARETLAYLVGSLAVKGRWTPAHATRELRQFAKVRRDLIGPALIARLKERQRRPLPREERRVLGDLLRDLAKSTPSVQAKDPQEDLGQPEASDPWRAAFQQAAEKARFRMLDALLADPGPTSRRRALWAYGEAGGAVRAHIVRRLVDGKSKGLLPRIMGWYAGEEELGVRTEIVRAVGLLGGDAHVRWLGERALNLRLEKAALLALARIRTPDALAALQTAEARIARMKRPDAASRAKWIAYLRSEAFARSDLAR